MACSSWLAQFFLYHLGPPVQEWHQSQRLASSTSVTDEDNTPQSWLQANLMEAFSRLRTPLPRHVKVSFKLTRSNQHMTAPPADSKSPSEGSHPVYRYLLPPCRHDSHTEIEISTVVDRSSDCQLDRIHNHLADTQLSMGVREVSRMGRGRKTHSTCCQHHPVDWDPWEGEGESGISTSIPCILFYHISH